MEYTPRPFALVAGQRSYSPELQAVISYVEEELKALSRSLVETPVLESRTISKEPKRPRDGMIVVADGTDWDPGSGAGAYARVAGAWVSMGGGAADHGSLSGLGDNDHPQYLLRSNVTKVTVNFSDPSPAKFFNVAFPGATVGQKVLATVSLDMPAGVNEDELELEPIVVAGYVSTINEVRLLVCSSNTTGLICGQRAINVALC